MSLPTPHLDRRMPAAFAAALILVVLAPCLADADSPFTGLELVPSKSVGALYRRPDVDISAYSKIMIGEPTVEFSKNWNPRNYGKYGLSAAQLTKIRVDLAAMARGAFAKVLGDGGYEIVTEPGDGVLVITPNIVNLFINAPDVKSPGRSRTYTMEAGSATLALQVNDAVDRHIVGRSPRSAPKRFFDHAMDHVCVQSSGGRGHAQGLGRTIETRVGCGAEQIMIRITKTR